MHGHSRDQIEHARSSRFASREEVCFDFLVGDDFASIGLLKALFKFRKKAEALNQVLEARIVREFLDGVKSSLFCGSG